MTQKPIKIKKKLIPTSSRQNKPQKPKNSLLHNSAAKKLRNVSKLVTADKVEKRMKSVLISHHEKLLLLDSAVKKQNIEHSKK